MCTEIWCVWPLTASITVEVKKNYAYATTQRILNKFIELNLPVGFMVWLWCCLFQDLTTSRHIDEIQTIHIKMAALVTKVGDTNLKIHHQYLDETNLYCLHLSLLSRVVLRKTFVSCSSNSIKMRWALLKSKAHSGKIINKNKMALVHTCLNLC